MRKHNPIPPFPFENPNKVYEPEDGINDTISSKFSRIYNTIDNDGYNKKTRDAVKEDIKHIQKHIPVSDKSIILLARILCGDGTTRDELMSYLGCNPIEFNCFKQELEELLDMDIIWTGFSGYSISKKAWSTISGDKAYEMPPKSGLDCEQLFTRIRKYEIDLKNDGIDNESFDKSIDLLIKRNDHLNFCKKVMESISLSGNCDLFGKRIFIYLCHRLVNFGDEAMEISDMLRLADDDVDQCRLSRIIQKEHLDVQREGLVGFGIIDGFVNTETLALTEKAKKEFLSEISHLPVPKLNVRDLVSSKSIKEKQLFYNKKEDLQINQFQGLLSGANFRNVQKRLVERGMRRGFNALFYGGPGTGKTACAYELARRTGRDIFHIDMSKLRSKWVGDSEKNIKAVFTLYRKICKTKKRAPILLFNEADAIFAKRFENARDSVDQMNNTIQNIILEEMENIDGILIATTNLTVNLDPAFERRFIFKIEFNAPEKESRAKIWQSLIPSLSDEDVSYLAERYEFSGGNIENIARKSNINYILEGQEPDLKGICRYCDEEKIASATRNKIGFK